MMIVISILYCKKNNKGNSERKSQKDKSERKKNKKHQKEKTAIHSNKEIRKNRQK